MFDKKYLGTLEDAKLLISKINEVYSLKIDFDTTIQQLAKLLDPTEKFLEIYEEKKELSVQWHLALKNWIEEIEQEITLDESDWLSDRLLCNLYTSFLHAKKIKVSDIPPPSMSKYTLKSTNHFVETIIKSYQYASHLEELKKERDETTELYGSNSEISKQNNKQSFKSHRIKWLKNSNLIAYLITELRNNHFIDEENIWDICENIFIDKKGSKINATTFTSMVTNYTNNNNLNHPNKPKEHKGIDTIIKALKDLDKE